MEKIQQNSTILSTLKIIYTFFFVACWKNRRAFTAIFYEIIFSQYQVQLHLIDEILQVKLSVMAREAA